MSALHHEAESSVREIRLLDGRRIAMDLKGITTIPSDIAAMTFDFSCYSAHVTWHRSVLSVLLGLLATHSIVYANRCAYHTARLVRDINDTDRASGQVLTLDRLESWPEQYGASTWPFFQAVLGHWVKSGLPGLHVDVQDFLQSPEKWEEQGNGWYFSLVANDPERGALTEQELKSVQDGINRAYERGAISLADWALVWFLVGTGVRPIQIARITVGDVLINDGPEGKEVTLCIPLAKGENVVVKERWKRKAPTVLTEVLLRYLEHYHRNSSPDTPLFVNEALAVRSKVASIFSRIETYSTRLMGPIPMFPYRLRYTLGTRALSLGASDHEVARLLTHRTTHCIQYYRAAMPMLQAPIRTAIGPEMAFLAQAFQGRLINRIDDATRKGEAGAVIRDFAHLMGQTLGACGTRAECHQDAPRACLYCRKFEPLRDAPWEELLQVLIDDMEKETEDRIRLITLDHINAVRGIIAERDTVPTSGYAQ